jgi:hypothetical protein
LSRYLIFAILCVVVIGIGALVGYRQPAHKIETPEELHRPVELTREDYVSSNACRSCHPDQYSTWEASWHRTMTQVARPKTVAVPLDDTDVTIGSKHYWFFERDGDIWVQFADPNWVGNPRSAPEVEHRIELTTGSHHFQVFWYAAGSFDRSLRMLEAVYIIDTDEWASIGSVFLKAPEMPLVGINGLWNANCIECHTTRSRQGLVPGEAFDSDAVEFGIACESCHGPGEEHIRAHQSPLSRYAQHWTDEPDPTIVNPSRLDPEREALVCGQCHALFSSKGEAELERWRKNGSEFTPGDDEFPLRNLVGNDKESYWPDGLVRTTGREFSDLLVSPCFTHGDPERGIMTCSSCHSMHQQHDDERPLKAWADRQLKRGMGGRQACIQCHLKFEDSQQIAAHTHHRLESTASDCKNCHMPHTSWGQQRAIRSHAITSPNAATAMETGRPDACNLCHLDKKLSWTAHHLDEWYGQQPPVFAGDAPMADEVAVGPAMMITGDAGQRALISWALGWEEAQAAAGTWWMPPFLALAMDDPYNVVRFRGYQSLKTLNGYEEVDFVFDGDRKQRSRVIRTVQDVWEKSLAGKEQPQDARALLVSQGTINTEAVQLLLPQRDNRQMYLPE